MTRLARDFAGLSFGRLTVLKKIKAHGEAPLWLCRCVCGNLSRITTGNLARQKSCGCLRAEKSADRPKENAPRRDLTGQTFGSLLVLGVHAKRGSHWRWLCKCVCGAQSVTEAASLIDGRTKSCGCKSPFALTHGQSRTPEYKNAHKNQRRARIRGVKNTFTTGDWKELVARSKGCHWCKRPFNKTRRPTHDHVIPIVRGGSNTVENSVCACMPCNVSKNSRLVNPANGQGILL